jgi:hypothetical protein
MSDNQRLPLPERGELESSYAPDPAAVLKDNRLIAASMRVQAEIAPGAWRDFFLARARYFENGADQPIDVEEMRQAQLASAQACIAKANEITDDDEEHTLTMKPSYSTRAYWHARAARYERLAQAAEGQS